METTADSLDLRHDRALTTPPSRGARSGASELIHTRYLTTAIVTVAYFAVSVAMIAVLGMAVLPMFVVALPFGLVLFWETADVLRSDELRDVPGRKTAPARMPRPSVNVRSGASRA